MMATAASTQDHKALIMVVDDNREYVEGIKLTLHMNGYKVWQAENGRQALNKLKAVFLGRDGQGLGLARLPDIILADIMMPVMDGYDFYENVRANPYLNHIPFIFLTAKDRDIDIRYGKELGSDDYLSKTSPPEDLLASIRGKLDRVKQQRLLATQRITPQHTAPEIDRSFRPNIIVVIVIFMIVVTVLGLGVPLLTGLLG